jgi:hypothetical protein
MEMRLEDIFLNIAGNNLIKMDIHNPLWRGSRLIAASWHLQGMF